MKTHFSFGKNGIEVSVPSAIDCLEIRSKSAAALANAALAIEEALDRPIGCDPLADLAAGKKTAAISVCDIPRPAPNPVTLPPLLKRLEDAGIPTQGITILIATGLHLRATEDEINTIVGPGIASTYRVISHDALVPACWRPRMAAHPGAS